MKNFTVWKREPEMDYYQKKVLRNLMEYSLHLHKNPLKAFKIMSDSDYGFHLSYFNYHMILDNIQRIWNTCKIDLPEDNTKYDLEILYWLCDIYEQMIIDGYTLKDATDLFPPEWVYPKFTPLHETSVPNAIHKMKTQKGIPD